MFVMTEPQWREFIFAGTRTGKVATVRPDGRPHNVPIWFVADGDSIVFSSGEDTVKTRNIAANGKATMCVDLEEFPYEFVMLECDAAIERLPVPELLAYTTRIAKRYVADDQAEAFGRRNAVDTEVLIRLTVNKAVAWGGMSD